MELLEATESRLRAEIVERERAERQARSNESFLRAVFETSPDPISINRMVDGAVVDFNAQYGALVGITREEGLGRPILELNLVADPQQVKDYVRELMNEGSVTNLPMDLRSDDVPRVPIWSRRLWPIWTARPCAITIARDISGVREAEDLLQKVAKASPDPIVVTSYPEGRMIYCNRQYEEWWAVRRISWSGALCLNFTSGRTVTRSVNTTVYCVSRSDS